MKPIQFNPGNHHRVVTIYSFSHQLNCPVVGGNSSPQDPTRLWQQLLDVGNWHHWLPDTDAVSLAEAENFGRGSIVCAVYSNRTDQWQVTCFDDGLRIVLQNAAPNHRCAWSIATTGKDDATSTLTLDTEFEFSGWRRVLGPLNQWRCKRWSHQFQSNLQNWLNRLAP